MTKSDKAVTRETSASDAGRAIIVQVQGQTIRFRLKGTQKWYVTTVKSCYVAAVRASVVSERLEKKRLREERRKAK